MQQPETMSMLEEPLYAPPFPKDVRARLDSDFAQARDQYARDPSNIDSAIAYVRAQAALGQLGDALESLAHAIEKAPDDQRLVLERAKILVVYRKFDAAERDARKALDALPESSCTLGFVLYLKMQFPESRSAFEKCSSPGLFKYLADRRAGGSTVPRPDLKASNDERPTPDLKMPGSLATRHEQPRLTMAEAYAQAAETMAGEKAPRKGHTDKAEDTLKQIVEKDHDHWLEPTYIAAEVDYARIIKAEGKFHRPAGRKKK
jgi:tetratricopeptide (TPR) repeat protein